MARSFFGIQWTTCAVFLMSIALAMAELGSAAPTSGGLYYWTFKFSSPKWRHFLSWIVACKLDQDSTRHALISMCNADYNTVENIAAIASIDWGCAVQITAAVSIGSGLKFQATSAQTLSVSFTLFSSDILIISHFVRQWCILCYPSVSRCALYTQSGRYCTVAVGLRGSQRPVPYPSPWLVNYLPNPTFSLAFTLIIAIPAATPTKFRNSAEYVFGNFTNRELNFHLLMIIIMFAIE